MLTQKFKTKARSIALKAFVYEMKKMGLYPTIMQATVGMISNQSKNAAVFCRSMQNELIQPHFKTLFYPKKVLFKMVNEKFKKTIEDNAHCGKEIDEYDYLTNCVNTLVQIYLEWNIRVFKKLKPEINDVLVSKNIHITAGKKLFGGDFKIKEYEPSTNSFEHDYFYDLKDMYDKLFNREWFIS